MTPPSAMASRTTQTNAGPEPQTAVTASKCCPERDSEFGQFVVVAKLRKARTFSSMKRHFPRGVKSAIRISRLTGVFGSEGSSEETTVMPSRICVMSSEHSSVNPQFGGNEASMLRTLLGVLGMLRTTVQVDGTHSRIIEIVVPAKIEMRSFPSSASDMPGARRRCAAS